MGFVTLLLSTCSSGAMKHPASIAHRAPAAGRACSPTKAHRSGGRVGSLKHAAQKKNRKSRGAMALGGRGVLMSRDPAGCCHATPASKTAISDFHYAGKNRENPQPPALCPLLAVPNSHCPPGSSAYGPAAAAAAVAVFAAPMLAAAARRAVAISTFVPFFALLSTVSSRQ